MSSETDLRRIVSAAQADDHRPICPTHFAENLDGQVIGYASIGIVPMIFCWTHTNQVRARESFALLARVEREARRVAPAGVICTPCTFASPFFKYMTRLGYCEAGQGGFFLKQLPKDKSCA